MKKSKKLLAFFLAFVIALCPCFCASAGLFDKKKAPQTLRLVVPEDWEMDIGDSRSVEPVFSAGVTNRVLKWSTDPADVASVDVWGRVTAEKEGSVTVTAKNSDGLSATAVLNVVKNSTKHQTSVIKKDYMATPADESTSLQKLVDRFPKDSDEVPAFVKDTASYANNQVAVTQDGASWAITSYGVLRVDSNETNPRDKEQRFMGDRYFYSPDTGNNAVKAVFPDEGNGIWTVMDEGYTHIKLVEMSGTEKAVAMSDATRRYVQRRGMVSEAHYDEEKDFWKPTESDNDGLWTSMYGAGELMRYAVLKNDPNASRKDIREARESAKLATEAVLLLTYISMRQGTVESLVHAQRNGTVSDLSTGKWYGEEVLKKGGNYSQAVPEGSIASEFEKMSDSYMKLGKKSYTMKDNNLELLSPGDWEIFNKNNVDQYATRTRLLEGFWSRTYSIKGAPEDEGNIPDGYIHWQHNGDGTATGVSTKKETDSGYLLNGENLRGVTVDASGEIPQRLWDDLIGSDYDISDIYYKGDTSADEIIGHLFIYKLAYDILGKEDEEIKNLIVRTVDSFAQHIVDNGYSLCDGSGQPTTWGKFGRTYLHNGQVLGGVPLQTSVILSAFKLASYVTGDDKWENEYRMAALDPAYEYAKAMTQEWERYQMCILDTANGVSGILGFILRPLAKTKLFRTVYRLILNYSDEEMAMLAYYLLFQLEDDEKLLSFYRDGLEDWWYSMSHSENPLWYYIYQLAYPNEAKTDIYGNDLVKTAAWSLGRHPVDTRCYLASNANRDDIAVIDLETCGIDGTHVLSYDPNVKKPCFAGNKSPVLQIIGIVFSSNNLKWKVAAPDERSLHKYNGESYELGKESDGDWMEGSTTYTLPYWFGRYHSLCK